jgi:hypothetical protein
MTDLAAHALPKPIPIRSAGLRGAPLDCDRALSPAHGDCSDQDCRLTVSNPCSNGIRCRDFDKWFVLEVKLGRNERVWLMPAHHDVVYALIRFAVKVFGTPLARPSFRLLEIKQPAPAPSVIGTASDAYAQKNPHAIGRR